MSFKRVGERRRASTVGQKHVKGTQGRACRGAQGMLIAGQVGDASWFPGRAYFFFFFFFGTTFDLENFPTSRVKGRILLEATPP